MSLSVAVLDALMATGATREQIAAAVRADIGEREALEAARLEAKRGGNRERQQRKRAKTKLSRPVTTVTRDKCDAPPNDIDILTPREGSEAKASSPPPWALPAGVSLQVWSDFLTNRKRKRLPNTPTAWKSFGDDLIKVSAETGIPPPKLIELCTAKGWGGIYDPREQRHERPNSPQSSGIGSTERAMQSALASIEGRGVGAGHPH